MKIALSVPDITKGKGGAERTATNLANEMVARGHQVLIHASATANEKESYPLDPLVELLRIPLDRHYVQTIRQEIERFSPDVCLIFYYDRRLFLQYAIFDGIAPIAAQECTNPGRLVTNLIAKEPSASIYSAFAAREAFIHGLSGIRFTMDSYVASLPLEFSGVVSSFPNAYAQAERRSDLNPAGRKRIICVSGLKNDNKRGVVLASAFGRIAAKYPDWDLHFLGSSAFARRAKSEMSSAGTSLNQLFIRGHVDAMEAEYQQAQINVICSLQEGCPNAVCEAMAYGVPSIGFRDCPGTNELIRHEENGLLAYRSDEIASLSECLERLMADVDLRERLGRQAYKDAADLLDPCKIYDRWEELFLDVKRASMSRTVVPATRIERVRKRFLASNGHFKRAYEKFYAAPLVSFVVPLFNKEKYIIRTLQSIQSCNYPNKEIIVVDDASTDESLVLVNQFAKRANGVRIIQHRDNRGLSASRNTGAAAAQGEYVQFWDADDIYNPDGLARLVWEMEEDGSDIGTGLALRRGEVLPWYEPSVQSRRRTTFELCPESFSASSTCFKVYRRDFLSRHVLEFIPGLYMQDTEFNLRAFPLAKRITVSPYALGEYQSTEGSGSKSFSAKRVESCFRIEQETKLFFQKNGLERFEGFRQMKLIEFVFAFFVRRLLQVALNKRPKREPAIFSPEMEDPELSRRYLERFRQIAAEYEDGLRLLAHSKPFRALGYVALGQARYDIALNLFLARNIPPGLSGILADDQRFSMNELRLWHELGLAKEKAA